MPIKVVIAIIYQQHQLLLSVRQPHQTLAGYHEFPGGKVEHGEALTAALDRELDEELGIHPLQPLFIRKITTNNADKTFELYFYKVKLFTGTAHSAEGQTLQWIDLDQLSNYQLPPANAELIHQIQLNRQLQITPALSSLDKQKEWIKLILSQTEPSAQVYFRPQLTVCTQLIECLVQAVQQRPDIRWIINIDIAKLLSSEQLSAIYAIHFKHQQLLNVELDQLQQYRQCTLIAACHDLESIQHANHLLLDAITLSPVKETATHPESAALQWQQFQSLCAQANMPVFALGGIKLEDQATAKSFGAYGIAGIGAFYHSSNLK